MATPAIERFTVHVRRQRAYIGYEDRTSGPALLLIHGALLNAALSWGAVLAKLAGHFTVYAMDRRGRAPSGDAESYSISMEAGDIARVVEAIGQPVTVLAHSYGALATLECVGAVEGCYAAADTLRASVCARVPRGRKRRKSCRIWRARCGRTIAKKSPPCFCATRLGRLRNASRRLSRRRSGPWCFRLPPRCRGSLEP